MSHWDPTGLYYNDYVGIMITVGIDAHLQLIMHFDKNVFIISTI